MATASPLSLHPGLMANSRLQSLASHDSRVSLRDWLILISAGAVAACASNFLDFNLRVPGHSILRVAFPIALGLALVPRHGAGCVMAVSAALTAGGLRLGGLAGEGLSLGALTSLVATGLLFDWTLRRAHGGWRLYASFALAGLASNLLALAVRGGAKVYGFEHVGARPFSVWLPQAAVTYVVCGLLAGLISAAILFCARDRNRASLAERAA